MASPPFSTPGSTGVSVPLTPAVIARVREGVAAARHPGVRRYVRKALGDIAAIAAGKKDPRVSGRFRRRVMRCLIRALFQVNIEHPERIPREPVVLVANHLNHIDPFLVLASVPSQPYYYILGDARTLYNKSWKRWIVGNAGGVIPLERWWKEEQAVITAAQGDRPDLQPLAAAIQQEVPNSSSIQQLRQIDQAVHSLLSRGDGLLLFPEGRLGETEGQLQRPLKRGTLIYALRANVPVVPMAIVGTQDLYWRKPLTLRFGEPLRFPPQRRPKRRDLEAALSQLEEAMTALLPDAYHDPPGPKYLRRWLNRLFW